MEPPALIALFVAILAGAGHLAVVSILLRATSGTHAITIMACSAVLLLATVPLIGGERISFWHFAAFFAAAASLVVFLYGALLKSLSLAMLVEISRTPPHFLSLGDLSDRVTRPAFAARAVLLVASGFALHDDAGYEIAWKGQHAAERIQAIRRFLRLDSAGLYDS